MRIPDPYENKRIVSSPSKPVVSQNTGIISQAAGDLASELKQIADRRTEYQVAQARAALLTGQAQREEALATDRDYEDLPERYETDVREQLQSAAEQIKDRRARNAFIELEGEGRVQEGLSRARSRAFEVEADIGRNQTNESLNALNKAGINGPDPQDAIDTVDDILVGAVEAGYYDAEQAGNMGRAWRDQFAIDKIASMPPQRRLEALNQPWAENLPASTRARLLEQAEADQREVAAVMAVDDLIDRGLSRSEGRRELRKIEDVDLRKDAEGRFDYELRQREAEETDAQTDIIERRHMDIRSGKLRVSDLPRDEVEALTASQVSGLQSLEAGAFSAAVRTDRTALAQVYDLIDAGDMGVARRFVLENADRFSDGDFEQYLGKTASDNPNAIESIRSTNQMLGQIVTDAGITNKDKAAAAKGEIYAQVDAWQMGFQREQGREPSDAELQEKARELSTEFILTQSDWNPFTGARKGRLYEGLSINDVPDDHLNAVLSALGTGETVRIEQADVREIYGAVMSQFEAAGVSDPSPEEIRNGVEYMRQQNAD